MWQRNWKKNENPTNRKIEFFLPSLGLFIVWCFHNNFYVIAVVGASLVRLALSDCHRTVSSRTSELWWSAADREVVAESVLACRDQRFFIDSFWSYHHPLFVVAVFTMLVCVFSCVLTCSSCRCNHIPHTNTWQLSWVCADRQKREACKADSFGSFA